MSVAQIICANVYMTTVEHPYLTIYTHILPFIMGRSFHTPSPPTEVNCPREVSKRKRGIPANTRVKKYGIRKAPKQIKTKMIDKRC